MSRSIGQIYKFHKLITRSSYNLLWWDLAILANIPDGSVFLILLDLQKRIFMIDNKP